MSKQKIQLQFLALLILTVAIIVVLLPLFHPGFYTSDDGDWMVIRLSAFYQSWREGQFPVRFLDRLNFGYGYPVANFLYPGYLYIGSILHALGMPFVSTVKLLFGTSIIVGTGSIFYWLRRKYSPVVSLFGALNFLCSPYLLYDVFTRGSLGEVLAMGVAAFAFYCLEAGRKFWFTVSFALLILSHNSLALLFSVFFVSLILIRKQFSYVCFMLIAIGMTTFFWAPALLERQFVIFDSVSVSNPMNYFASGSLWYLIGIASVFGCLVVLTDKRKLDDQSLWYVFIFLLSVSVALPISQFFWNINSFVKLFQFPYRMLSISLFAGSFLVSDALNRIHGSKRMVLMVLLCIVWVATVIYTVKNIEYTSQPEGFYTTNEATTTVANEYMPIWVHDPPKQHPPTKIEFLKGRGTFLDTQITTNKIHTTVHALENSIIQINTVYYPGWGAMLDNARAEIHYDNPKGVMQISVLSGIHDLTVGFRETVPRFTTTVISFLFIIGYILWIIIPKKFFVSIFHWFQQLQHEPLFAVPKRGITKKRK
jgi:hypothetical protein